MMQAKKIYLEVYNSNWPKVYLEEAKRLLKIIPARFRAKIEHVGSTALLGCYSRHAVDILIGVKKEEDVLALKDYLVSKKYRFWERHSSYNNVVLYKEENHRVTHEIHIVKYASPDWNRFISFRDLLNKNPQMIKEYTDFKLELAKQNLESFESYFVRREKFKNEILNIK